MLDAFEQGTRAFLEAWYGIDLAPARPMQGHEPLALRQWWAWQALSPVPLTYQNTFPDTPTHHEGYDVFYVENQAVVEWAYPTTTGDPDPPVFERLDDHRALWEPVGMKLSKFIHHIAAFEACIGCDQALWTTDPSPDKIRELTRGLTEVDSQAIQAMRLFVGPHAVTLVSDNELALWAKPHTEITN